MLMSPPPPSPWMKRAAAMSVTEGASEFRIAPSVNMPSAMNISRRRPNESPR